MATKVQIGLKLAPEFVERIDAARGDVSRTRFIERALEAALSGSDDVGAATMSPAHSDPPPSAVGGPDLTRSAPPRAPSSGARTSADVKRGVRPIPKTPKR